MKMKPLEYKVFGVRMNMDQFFQPIVLSNIQDTTLHGCSMMDEDDDDGLSSEENDTIEDNFDEELQVLDRHNMIYQTGALKDAGLGSKLMGMFINTKQ